MVTVLSVFCWGMAVTAAQHMPPSGPPQSPTSGSSRDCYVGNGTACFYSFGQCQANADCNSVLAASLRTYGFGTLPSDAEIGCVAPKCDLLTPSMTCRTNLGLPVCGAATSASGPSSGPSAEPFLAPIPAPVPIPTPAVAPGPGLALAPAALHGPTLHPPPAGQAVFPGRCSKDVLGTGRGCCVEFGGSCQTFRDCVPSIAAYLQTAIPRLSAPPSDSVPACYAGQCYYASQSTACSKLGVPLPRCSDGFMCAFSIANMSYLSPPPAVDIHRITTPAAPASVSATGLPPPPPAPLSAGSRPTDLSSVLLLLAVVAAVAVPILTLGGG